MPKSRSSSLSTNAHVSPQQQQQQQQKQLKQLGDDLWNNRTEKVNAELFTMTYGTIVSQLCRDLHNDYDTVNTELYNMGYNIGVRLIEDFLARTALPRCNTLQMTSDVICKVAFKCFLNLNPDCKDWSSAGDQFTLVLVENPLNKFVELPQDARDKLWYSNILCGVLKGALQMVQLDCEVTYINDVLRGDMNNEIRIKLLKILKDEIPIGED